MDKGGYGKVYSVRKDGRAFAVKVSYMNTKEDKEATNTEILIHQTINELQENLKIADSSAVVMYGNEEQGKRNSKKNFMFMELADMTLQQYIEEFFDGDMYGIDEGSQFFQVISLAIQLLEAVYSLHTNNIIHGDIKPANILLFKTKGGEYKLKLSDFGLSCIKSKKLKIECKNVGTPIYMANDLFRDSNTVISKYSDLFSVGAVLFNMFTEGDVFNWVLQNLSSESPQSSKGYTKNYQSKALENAQSKFKNKFGNIATPIITKVIKSFLDPNPNSRDDSATLIIQAIKNLDYLLHPELYTVVQSTHAKYTIREDSKYSKTYGQKGGKAVVLKSLQIKKAIKTCKAKKASKPRILKTISKTKKSIKIGCTPASSP